MKQQSNGIFGDEERNLNLREKIITYLTQWPLFVVCIFLSLCVGILYTYYAIPKYIAKTSFLIKGLDDQNSNSADLVEAALNGKKEVNISNEIEQVKSASLMRRTVAKNNFNIFYYIKGRLHSIEIYQAAPFTLIPKQLKDSNSIYEFQVSQFNAQGGTILYGAKKDEKSYPFRWDAPFVLANQTFVLSPNKPITGKGGGYIVKWVPVGVATAELSGNFSVKSYDEKTSIMEISLKTENIERGKDVLNAVFREFNLSDIEARKNITFSTVNFINDRLTTITNELKNVEGDIESYQGSHQVVDIKAQLGQSLANSDETAKAINSINVQQGVTKMVSDYVANPANDGKVVPATLGVNDPGLTVLLEKYNELQIKKEREAPNVAPNSTVMQDINAQTANLKSSIQQSLGNISKSLTLQAGNFQQQNGISRGFLSAVPRNTRALQEIQRKQSITEGIYLYLFQKREEVAISGQGDNVPHYVQIDPATGSGPVEPDRKNILFVSTMIGFCVAFGFVYIRGMLNNKITSRESIIRQTSIPLLGQIAHILKNQKKPISVTERSIIGEQFRAIRTNLAFLVKEKMKKVIMVTSTVSGEGKSFVSLNLAAVYAVASKKVALLEFDIRQPMIANNLQINTSKGITNYLAGETDNLSELYFTIDEIPTLHVYPCGPTSLNPADLLLADNMSRLFESLRAKYDYVIVDSPPAGLVSDPFILGAFSDLVIYVVRSRKTTKKQIDFLNDIVSDRTLNNVTMVLNDVRKGNNQGYGYGSDKNYGYYNGVRKNKKYSAV